MESSIKHTHLRQTWHQFLHSVYALQIGWVVQRSQIRAFLESLQHFVSEDNALVELLTTMHHTVTNCINLIKTLDDTNLRVSKQREDELNALCMLRDIVHNLLFLTIGQLYLYEGTIKANTLSTTTRHHALIVHIVQGVLDRRRATI